MSYTYIYILYLRQIIRYFGFSKFIGFTIYLDIMYIQVHSKNCESRKAKTFYNLNGESNLNNC